MSESEKAVARFTPASFTRPDSGVLRAAIVTGKGESWEGVVECGNCGSVIKGDGSHACPAVTRKEFDALRKDLAMVAHIVRRITEFGSDRGIAPFGGKSSDAQYEALRRIASEGES